MLLPSDVVVEDKRSGAMKLVIRQHKTSKSTGEFDVPLPPLMLQMMELWIKVYRPYLTRELCVTHDWVFFHPSTTRPFTTVSFSKYMTACLTEIAGQKANLQIMRRSFAEGVTKLFSCFHCTLHRLPG